MRVNVRVDDRRGAINPYRIRGIPGMLSPGRHVCGVHGLHVKGAPLSGYTRELSPLRRGIRQNLHAKWPHPTPPSRYSPLRQAPYTIDEANHTSMQGRRQGFLNDSNIVICKPKMWDARNMAAGVHYRSTSGTGPRAPRPRPEKAPI